MAKCARCRTELIGSARFCASCGAPVPEATTLDPQIRIQVDPFASTATPESLVNPYATTKKPSHVHKPSEPPPVAATPVSPLAASASLPDRGAYDEVIAAHAESKPAARKPGTQMMTNAPAKSAPAKKPAARTVAMGNWNQPKPASAPAQPAAPSAMLPSPAPSTPKIPASVAAPSALPSSPAISHGQPSYPQAPSGPGGWGWNAPAPHARPLVPGARVTVTWSNGQRYPATVNQVNGTRCLVVFPDGQQHWVESQFVGTS